MTLGQMIDGSRAVDRQLVEASQPLPHELAQLVLAATGEAIFSPSLWRRPGDHAPGGNYYASFAPPPGESLLQRAFTRDSVCGECHTPIFSAGRTRVMPVTLPARYMFKGWFSHKPHAQEKCTSCHAAETSASASDLLLPGIARCRTCHLGEASKAAVPSGCAMCHSYHPAAAAPRAGKPDKR